MKFFFVLLFLFFFQNIYSQKTDLIIDTDCASDDYRTICMLLASNDFNINAILTNDGSCNPHTGARKVNELLKSLNNNNIKIGEGPVTLKNPPVWRSACERFVWGQSLPDNKYESAFQVTANILEKNVNQVVFLQLGSLTNIAELVEKRPDLKKSIRKIIWYNSSANPLNGTNYDFDRKAADFLFQAGIPVDVIMNLAPEDLVFDKSLLEEIKKINTVFSQKLVEPYSNKDVYETFTNHQTPLWDEITAVYLIFPELFDMMPDKKSPNISIPTYYPAKVVRKKILEILTGNYYKSPNVVFEIFPADSDNFQFDVQSLLPQIIEKYGKEEWRVCVLTNEIHRHLGIYSIVGAKMGLKAREELNAPLDRLEVVSYAGNRPPVSCLNDGLQISTGATLGYGTIKTIDDGKVRAEAVITYNGKKLKFKLKEEYEKQVEKDIQNGIAVYGNLTAGYWKLVRNLAIKYWLEWDRNKIFDIEQIN